MSDSGAEADVENDPVETLRNRHKQEKKQLQSTIYNLRKTCPKKEKSTLQERISILERDLKVKQDRELDDLQYSLSSFAIDSKGLPSSGIKKEIEGDINEERSRDASVDLSVRASQSLNNSEYVGDDEDDDAQCNGGSRAGSFSYQQQKKKGGKAQKRREKAEKAHQERLEKQKLQSEAVERSNKVADAELKELVGVLTSRSLQLVQVPADGDCFYHAIQKHLKSEEKTDDDAYSAVPTVDDLRNTVSEFLMSRESEYAAFFDPEDNNSEARTFAEYCDKIKTNHEWAGHMEITAMSNHLSRPIEIVQAASNKSMLIGEDQKSNPPITLVYHRNLFNCGEHYNLALPICE